MSLNRIVVFLFVCIALVVAQGCKQRDEPASPAGKSLPTVSVRVMTVAAEIVSSHNEVAGTIEAVERATISAKVAGVIEEMPVTLGSTVKKGDLLLKIRAGEITARVAQAKANFDQVRRNLEREKRLLASNAATRESVKSLEEAYQGAEAAYGEAKAFLSYTTVSAPFDGLVASKMANRGDLATAGAPLLVLTDNKRLQAVCPVPETFLLRIRPGDELSVKVPAAGVETTGRVKEIAPVADVQSRTTLVKIDIDAAENLLPGQFARVLLPGAGSPALFVPAQAVIMFGQMEKVFVVQDARAELRLVRSGSRRNGLIEVLSGLEAGEQVVIEGSEQLVDGQPVQVFK